MMSVSAYMLTTDIAVDAHRDQHSDRGCADSRGLSVELPGRQVGELRRDIEEEQRMLLHFQEQKMALAVQCYDLVDTHVQNLGRNMDGLREELEVSRVAPECIHKPERVD